MQRHLRLTYSQVSILYRQTIPPILMAPVVGLQGISTCSCTPGKLLLHEIFKSSPNANSNGVSTSHSKMPSNMSNSDTNRTARSISNIDPVLALLASKRTVPAITRKQVNETNLLEEMNNSEFEEPNYADTDMYDGSLTLENVLGQVNFESLTIRQSCHTIGKLAKLKPKPDLSILQNDDRFICVCNLIQRANFGLNPLRLIITLEGLQKLGLQENSSIVLELRNELKWVLRRCPLKLLAKSIKSMELSHKFDPAPTTPNDSSTTSSKEEDSVLHTSVDLMNRRWVEAVTGSDFIAIFGISSHLTDETNEKLEDRAYELVSHFSTMEMVKIVINLALQKRRPAPLLKAIAFHLTKTHDIIPAKDMIELMYAFSKINFVDQLLMQKLCLELAPEIHTISNRSLFSSLITTLGRTRYKPKELTDAMEEWIDKNFETMRPFDHAAWLLTSSVLNLKSDLSDKFCRNVITTLSPTNTPSKIEWINVVHAFLVLNCATAELLAYVLKPQFVLEVDKLNEQFVGPRIKLLNINEALKSMMDANKDSNTNIALLDSECVNKWSSLVSTNDMALSKLVLSTLEQFLPPSKYFIPDVRAKSGVYIDAVCALNSKREPVPINAQNLQSKSKDVRKIAIVVAGYTSLCLGSNAPTGQICLHERLLRQDGYNVVLVPFNEFSSRSTLLQRIKYLEARIKDLSAPFNRESKLGSTR